MLTPCCQSTCSPLIARVQVDYRVSIDYQWRSQPPHSLMTILARDTIPRADNQWVAVNWQRDFDLHSSHLSTYKRFGFVMLRCCNSMPVQRGLSLLYYNAIETVALPLRECRLFYQSYYCKRGCLQRYPLVLCAVYRHY